MNVSRVEEWEVTIFPGVSALWELIPLTMAAAGLVGAGWMALTIWREPKFHHAGYYMMINASACQMLCAVGNNIIGHGTSLLYRFVRMPWVVGPTAANRAVVFLTDFGYLSAFSTLTVISLQRLAAVYFYTHYRRLASSHLLLAACILLTWAAGLALSLPCALGPCVAYYSVTTSKWLFINRIPMLGKVTYIFYPAACIALMTVVYALVIAKLIATRRKVRHQPPTDSSHHDRAAGTDTSTIMNRAAEVRLCVQFLIISLLYVIPPVELFTRSFLIDYDGLSVRWQEVVTALEVIIWSVSYCSDPLVHAAVSRTFRRAMIAQLRLGILKRHTLPAAAH